MPDPGLQPERTGLAWARTAAGVMLNALLTLRAGLVSDNSALVAAGLLLALSAAALFSYRRSRARGIALGTTSMQAPAGALGALTLVTIGACLASMLAVWSGAGHLK